MRLPLWRYTALTLGCGALLIGLGWWPSHAWGGAPAVQSLIWAVAIGVLASLAGRGVLLALGRLGPGGTEPATAALGALGGRLFVSLVLVLIVVVLEPFPLLPFAVQAAIAYGTLLCLEVCVNLRELGEHQRRAGSESGTSDEPESNRAG